MFIAHDLAVVRHFCREIAVMYLGKVVEIGAASLYEQADHPYTQALLSAVPESSRRHGARRDRIRLVGDVPSPINPPSGAGSARGAGWRRRSAPQEPPLLQIGKSRQGGLSLRR